MANRPEPPPRSLFDALPRTAAAPPEPEAPALEDLGYSPDDLSPVHAKLGPLVAHWTDPHPATRPGAEAFARAQEASADAIPMAQAAEDDPGAAWADPFEELERRFALDGAWTRLPILANTWRAEAAERLVTPPPFQESAPTPPLSAWLIRRVARGSRWLR